MSLPPGSTILPKPKTLVACFDGTNNQFNGENTNVVKFFSLLKKDDPDQQMVYYQAGIGTSVPPGILSGIITRVAEVIDSAIAWYLYDHVMKGYNFLMQNYRQGDKICLFGFSRGAYTARALAGMLLKVGLLPKGNEEQIPFAFKLYQRTDKKGVELSAGFKKTFCRSVEIEFLGVWDTVASVGLLNGRTLPFVESNPKLKTFRHALSLDEHRARFRPTLYHRPVPSPDAGKQDPERASPTDAHATENENPRKKTKRKPIHISGAGTSDAELTRGSNSKSTSKKVQAPLELFVPRNSTEKKPDKEMTVFWETDVLEVWFAGCHTDVGGGSVSNGSSHSLSDISLRWMVRQTQVSQCGILFDDNAFADVNIPHATFPPGTATTAPKEEIELDRADALQKTHDQLKSVPMWWLLEILPLTYSYQDPQGVWHKTWSIHLGRGRPITNPHPRFHSSVRDRLHNVKLKYKPLAKLPNDVEPPSFIHGGTIRYDFQVVLSR